MKKKSKRWHSRIEIVIVCFCLAGFLLLLGLTCAYFLKPPRDTNGAETLKKFPSFSIKSFLEGDFQTDLEQAAKDQFLFHDQAIEVNAGINAGIHSIAKKTSALFRGEGFREELVPFGKVYRMYGTDWLTNLPYTYEEETAADYRKKADELNAFAKAHPEIKTYVYYCTRAEDLNWFDSAEGIESYPWYQLLENLLEEEVSFNRLKFREFSEYADRMYKTDHHWNNTGAAVGYADILYMMSKDFELGRARSILRTQDYDNLLWIGSRSRECGCDIREEAMDIFAVDEYILPEHTLHFGGREQKIGLKQVYDSGAVNREKGFDQYLNYFGFESDVITLQYEEGEKNLLIIGDSFARAVREPLSSHFKTTIFVNFRILGEVDIEEIIRENEIDAVLFIGQQDAWSGYYMQEEEAE